MNVLNTLRERFSGDVLSNKIIPDLRWNQSCEAYNIQVLLNYSEERNPFRSCQGEISNIERRNLHQCSTDSLHISIAWIIAVQQNYIRPRNELWEEVRERVCTQLTTLSHDTPSFKVRLTNLVATNTAVIAVGKDGGEIAKIRKNISERFNLPSETTNNSNIIHTTLFRYSKLLDSPKDFLQLINSISLDIEITVDHISIQKELVYPSLITETMFQVKLS